MKNIYKIMVLLVIFAELQAVSCRAGLSGEQNHRLCRADAQRRMQQRNSRRGVAGLLQQPVVAQQLLITAPLALGQLALLQTPTPVARPSL